MKVLTIDILNITCANLINYLQNNNVVVIYIAETKQK